MCKRFLRGSLLVWIFATCIGVQAQSDDTPPPPGITNFYNAGSVSGFQFPLYPAVQSYTILSGTNVGTPLAPDATFFTAPLTNVVSTGTTMVTNITYEWRTTNATDRARFYQLQIQSLSSNALLSANVLNRLAYGPSPDDLDAINVSGPGAYINSQLAPWNITEDVANTHTNLQNIQAMLVEPTNFVYATNAGIADLRAWHILRAVGARRQLLEILLQFFENHFVTEWSKSVSSYFNAYYSTSSMEDRLATQLEYMENVKWRNALLNPQCTFYDLLKVSAESPAMLIYLDTVTSRGDGNNVANENYARELMELFTMGVDNGYDQSDITTESRIWTGWRIEKVDFTNAFNPFAPKTTIIIPGSTNTSTTTYSNLFGVWAFNYKPKYHNGSEKLIFPGKIVPPRFGPPWTTRTYGTNTTPGLYQIDIAGHSTTDTNGIQEGYQFISHIANLPFTEEYISIKLCRLFVSDNFPNPGNDPNDPAYPLYNYAGGNLSPEAGLVHQCMLTWENSNPPGQIWPVLKTIFDSALFRGNGSASQKIKTPLEFTVSAIRALRSSTNGSNLAGTFTCSTDGYSIGGTTSGAASPLSRMGDMLLFDRSSPDGYPEMGPPWVSAGSVAERVRFVQSLCIAAGQSGHSGSQNGTGNDAANCVVDVVGLLKYKVPSSNWSNAGAVVDYFVGILFPGEGAGNLQFLRQEAVNYLNDGSADSPPSTTPFAQLAVSNTAGSAYDTRLRGMVALLMASQRFQEQ